MYSSLLTSTADANLRMGANLHSHVIRRFVSCGFKGPKNRLGSQAARTNLNYHDLKRLGTYLVIAEYP